MDYASARPQIKSGDVLAWTHRGWKSFHDLQVQIVRIFTRSEYSHVGISWCVGDRVLVLEAVSSGVRLMPLSMSLPCYWIPLGVWSEGIEKRALSQLGKPYSRWQAVLGGLGRLRIGADEFWQCAEYVAATLGLKSLARPDSVVDTALRHSKLIPIEG